jgi:hypothetical protein
LLPMFEENLKSRYGVGGVGPESEEKTNPPQKNKRGTV